MSTLNINILRNSHLHTIKKIRDSRVRKDQLTFLII